MADNWQAGHSNPAKFTPDGAVETSLDITGWDGNETGDIQDTTNSGTGGIQDNITGVLRGTWRVQADIDADLFPWTSTTPLIRFGTKGVLKVYYTTAKFDTIPVRVSDVHKASAVAGKVTYDFTVVMCASAGTYTRAT